jgi:LuxR family maltose regulon positive regulatory protein
MVPEDSHHPADGWRDLHSGGLVPPLMDGKLAVPSLRQGIVDRGRIQRALDAGRGAAVTLVAAPAGYGKTAEVRAWCASRDGGLAWVTLDNGDNNSGPVVAICGDSGGSGAVGARAGCAEAVGGGGRSDVAIDELMNGVATLGSDLVLVLDDLDAVVREECLSSIDYALAGGASNL